MQINIITVGKKPAMWVTQGINEYTKRFSKDIDVNLIEITPARRQKSSNTRNIISKEAERICAAIPDNNYTIALDQKGNQYDTMALSERLNDWIHDRQDICFIIGGADGLAPPLISSSNEAWSLSNFTMPHALVKILLIEQIYRSWSILNNHPYHRE